jgi:hypothetical protein
MPEDLEAFLGKSKIIKEDHLPDAEGSFACQECNEVVLSGKFDVDNKLIIWYCSNNHRSQVSI